MKPQYFPMLFVSLIFIVVVGGLGYLYFDPDFSLEIGDKAFLAVATGSLGSTDDNEMYDLNIKMCNTGGSSFTDLKIKWYVYGPDASSMPCKDDIDKGVISVGTLAKGKCVDKSLSLDTSLPQYVAGDDYHVVVSIYNGDAFVSNVDGSSGDDSKYDSCFSKFHTELSNPLNGCGDADLDGKFDFCQGVAWAFDIEATEFINKTECTVDTEITCFNDTTTEYQKCNSGVYSEPIYIICGEGKMCDAGICKLPEVECSEDSEIVCTSEYYYGYYECVDNRWGELFETPCANTEVCIDSICISSTCLVEGETLDETCPEGYSPEVISDKYICADGIWTSNKEDQCSLTETSSGIFIIILIGAIVGIPLAIIGVRKGWFKKIGYKLKRIKIRRLSRR